MDLKRLGLVALILISSIGLNKNLNEDKTLSKYHWRYKAGNVSLYDYPNKKWEVNLFEENDGLTVKIIHPAEAENEFNKIYKSKIEKRNNGKINQDYKWEEDHKLILVNNPAEEFTTILEDQKDNNGNYDNRPDSMSHDISESKKSELVEIYLKVQKLMKESVLAYNNKKIFS